MASKAVETIFSAVDRITPAFGKMRTGADRFAVAAKAAFRSVVPEASRLNDIIKGVTIGNLVTKGITTAVNAIRSNFSNAVTYASSLIEVQNIVDTVFGESTKTIDAFAKSAGKSFGLTELQAKKFSSTFGAMLSGIGIRGDAALGMSTGLAGLAGDLASFYNLSQEEAFSKLQSGLMGKTQPLQSIGIDVSATSMEEFAKAQGKVWKNMDRTNQTMLRYQYIMEKTKLAQGDYQKPIASWAVSMRNAANAIQEMWGKLAVGLMPTLIRFADMVTATVQKISAWADAHKAVIATKLEKFVNGILTAARELAPAFTVAFRSVIDFGAAIVSAVKDAAGLSIIKSIIQQAATAVTIFAQYYKAVIKIVLPMTLTLVKVITKIGPAILVAFVAFKTFSTVTAMINGVTVALQAMGVALTIATGPIGIVAAAIAALATGILMLNAASKKIHQERIAKYELKSEEELDSTYTIAQNLLVDRNTEVERRQQNVATLRHQRASGDRSVETWVALNRNIDWLRKNPRLNEEQALEIAAEQVKASRPEEEDEVEKLIKEGLEELKGINGLLGNIDENTGATSQKNLRWNKMGTEDFWETARLGV